MKTEFVTQFSIVEADNSFLAVTNQILPAFHQTESAAGNEEEGNRKSGASYVLWGASLVNGGTQGHQGPEQEMFGFLSNPATVKNEKEERSPHISPLQASLLENKKCSLIDPSCSQTAGLTAIKAPGPLKLTCGFNVIAVKIPEEFFRRYK